MKIQAKNPLLTTVLGALLVAFVGLWVTVRVLEAKSEGDLLLTVLILGCATGASLVFALSLLVRNCNLQQELKAAAKRRGQVEELSLAAAGLAHETKNPLGIIRGLAQQIAEDAQNSDDAREKAREIMEEADITVARLGDYMSYAKLRKPELEPIEAEPYLGNVCRLVRQDFENGDIDFAASIDTVTILADPDMLSQVVLNLLVNSQKSTAPGGKVRLFLKETKRKRCSLIVSDTGCGIPAEFLPDIFKPYSSRRSGGYGIGMAIVKKIVEESGWDIAVRSEEGKGAEIEISGIRTVDQGEA